MNIKGRVYHPVNTVAHHKALQNTLKLLMEAAFVVTSAPDDDVDGATGVDGVEGTAISIGKMKLKRKRNPRGKLTCITLTEYDIEQDVREALEKSLEQLLGGEFLIITNPSNDALLTDDDYQLRLDAVVMS